MHGILNIHFVFDEATVPGDTAEEKKAHVNDYLTRIAEQAADTAGDDATATGHYVVDEVTHGIEVKE